jgi:membrane-bound lytic murein transglycosylase B
MAGTSSWASLRGGPGSAIVTVHAADGRRARAGYQAAGDAYDVPWTALAAINKVETDFGGSLGPSTAAAVGWNAVSPRHVGAGIDGDGHADLTTRPAR